MPKSRPNTRILDQLVFIVGSPKPGEGVWVKSGKIAVLRFVRCSVSGNIFQFVGMSIPG